MATLDVEFARSQFPAFSRSGLGDRAFFENAGGSYPCRFVVDRLARFYLERKVQPYGAYSPSIEAGEEMDEARSRLSEMMGIGADELSFGPSTTQNACTLSQAFAEHLAPGDRIAVTNQDHEANTGPWRRLSKRGIEVLEWKADPKTGHLSVEDLEGILDRGVKLVCFPHCSNIVGEVNPVAEICAMARAAGAVSCVDGVSYAPHGLPDVGNLGADIYLFSTYKTYGPHQGLMAIRRELAQALPNQGHYFNAGSLTSRFTPAGPDHAQVAACAGIADYIDCLAGHHGIEGEPRERAAGVAGLFREHETRLLQPLLDCLSRKNSVRLLGPDDASKKVPTVAAKLDAPGERAARELAARGIMAGGGDFYGVRILEAMGVDPGHGVLRMSFVHYNTEEEVSRLVEALGVML